jgi:hypothetical protein
MQGEVETVTVANDAGRRGATDLSAELAELPALD